MKFSYALLLAVMASVGSPASAEIRVDADRMLVGNMYAPFCRTVGPDASEWDADITKMVRLGYTCLHGFCEWSRIERREGEYDFSETDRLLEICACRGVRAILNVATCNAVGYHTPAWLENRYSGRGLVDFDGGCTVNGQMHMLPCLDDPEYARLAKRYLTALARHYAGDRRVAGWVLWGEPAVAKDGKPICYCPHTVAAFRQWLAGRYGEIAKLNAAWGTDGPVDFASFDEVRPPRGAVARNGGYASWSDWREFMNVHFADVIGEADALMKRNGATQPTIVEMFCTLGGTGMCNDIWKLSSSCDIVGASLFCRPGGPIACSLVSANSVAAKLGKSVFVVEECGGHRGYFYDRWVPTEEEIRSEAVQAAGMGVKGLMYWCWRPRLSDFEGGTYGMCRSDGKPLPRAIAGGETAAALAALGRRLTDAQWTPQVGVFHLSRIHFADADATRGEVNRSEEGAIRSLLDLHVTPTLIDGEMLVKGLPENLRVLFLPFSYVMSDAETDALARFVREGGTVVADINLAFKRPDGSCFRNLPGGCLREVFGFEKDDLMRLDDASLLPHDNRYGMKVGDFEDVFEVTTASVLERHDARPLRTVNRYGKGRAYAFACTLFESYRRDWGNVRTREVLRGILAEAGVRPFLSLPELDAQNAIPVFTSRLVRPDGAKVLTFTNPGWKATDVHATVPEIKDVVKMYGPDLAVKSTAAEGGCDIRFSLKPWQSVMLEAK